MTNRQEPPLPVPVEKALATVVEASRAAFGPNLTSVVLYGSAAEGRLRPTSDVNVIFVLARFERTAVEAVREPLRLAAVAIRLTAMFLLESELTAAAEAFAAKFDDILRRRRVLHGRDVFAGLTIPRSALRNRLRQVLLNLGLRLRQAFAFRSLREEQLAAVVADVAGPLRSAAAALLELEGHPAASPKDALIQTAGTLAADGFKQPLAHLSQARETRALPPGAAAETLFRLIDLVAGLRARVDALP